MRHNAFPRGVTRAGILHWFRAARARSAELFALVKPEAYYERPIALRNPIVFYDGHLPGFMVNTLVKLTLNRDGIDERLETLFARGIDPEDEATVRNPSDGWPSREEVRAFAAACDTLVETTLAEIDLEENSEAVFTILEHELMHQETLLYMIHNLPYEKKRSAGGSPAGLPEARRQRDESRGRAARRPAGGPPALLPPGRVTLGQERDLFGWDNEFPSRTVEVGAFSIDPHSVTNGDYLEYMTATGASAPHFWSRVDDAWFLRGMFELVPLPMNAPVFVMHDEASAYARWRGMRLPTEAEFHHAAFGTPSGEERLHPWGDALPGPTHGNFDFTSFDPVDIGSYPEGVSAWGIHDLVGNGWEWTSSVFEGFPGFKPMPSYPQYSADFFDDAHYVLKGASPVTPGALIRRSFRNWFRPAYPYVFAKFRCASCT